MLESADCLALLLIMLNVPRLLPDICLRDLLLDLEGLTSSVKWFKYVACFSKSF